MSVSPLLPLSSPRPYLNSPLPKTLPRFGEKSPTNIPPKCSRHIRLFKAFLTCAAATVTVLACDYAALKMAYKTFCILRKPPSENTPITPWGVWTYTEESQKPQAQNPPATSKPQK